ncbi:hypothetical protein FLGE108171_15165 [Flavobacterium gelidilacus]|uniref:hypothetical protein n=1 Tax=Flavobacterium gelidilacus TaxID=206041 RepID=UPI00040509D7|nr:hypothetical protein [Flavobacterium gelidilacus]
MTLNINNRNLISLYFFLITSLLFLSCKGNNRKEQVNNEENIYKDSKVKLEEQNKQNDEWQLYRCYYFSNDEYDNPTITEEEVLNIFRKIKIFTSKDSLWLNNDISSYEIKTKNEASKYFRKDYEYEQAIKSFKYGFDIDIKNKPLSYIWLDPEKYMESPFSDYFNEGGSAIISNDFLFLKNYEGYMICYKKVDKNKIWDKKYCELPFYTGRAHSLCQTDSRKRYKDLCTNEYPLFYFDNDKELQENLKAKIPYKNLLYYYNLKTNIKDISTIVVITEHEEESYGDLFLVNLKGNEVVSVMENEEIDFFHAYNFEVKSDLTINVYDDNGMRPKEKISFVFKINDNGSFKRIQ